MSKLVLLDTVGYNQAGPDADQFEQTVEAAQQADLIFLVTPRPQSGSRRRREILERSQRLVHDATRTENAARPIVVTHIDLLSPAMEWSPPYDWRQPTTLKETNIAEATKAAREQFSERIRRDRARMLGREQKLHGIQEELVPEMTELLGEARAVAFLRCLHAEADERQVHKIFDQVLAVGKVLLGSLGK